jgi:hypothetical protein
MSFKLISSVNAIRQKVETHVASINTLSRFEAEIFSFTSTLEGLNDSQQRKSLKALIDFPEINNEVDLSQLNLILNSASTIDKKNLIEALNSCKTNCQYSIGEKRQQLRSTSESLAAYWDRTHLLLIIASITFCVFSAAIYFLYKDVN